MISNSHFALDTKRRSERTIRIIRQSLVTQSVHCRFSIRFRNRNSFKDSVVSTLFLLLRLLFWLCYSLALQSCACLVLLHSLYIFSYFYLFKHSIFSDRSCVFRIIVALANLRICSFASPGSFSIYSSAFQRRDLLSSRYLTCFGYSLIGLSARVRYLSPFISLLFPSKRQENLSSSIRSVFGLLSSFVQALPFHKFLQPFLRALEVFDTFHVEFYESSYGGVLQFILNHVCVYH